MCRDCKTTVFSKKDFAAEASHKPADQRSYENLLQFERGIRLLLPNFQRLLMALQDPDKPPSQQTLTEASKVRKRLIDSFGKYDLAAKRIRDLPTKSPAQAKLQKAIYQQSANFLSIHMLPLKSLPKILQTQKGQHIVSNEYLSVDVMLFAQLLEPKGLAKETVLSWKIMLHHLAR